MLYELNAGPNVELRPVYKWHLTGLFQAVGLGLFYRRPRQAAVLTPFPRELPSRFTEREMKKGPASWFEQRFVGFVLSPVAILDPADPLFIRI